MRKQKTLVLLLIFAMALSLLPQSAFAAKKKVKQKSQLRERKPEKPRCRLKWVRKSMSAR